jgi:hypothetical protein
LWRKKKKKKERKKERRTNSHNQFVSHLIFLIFSPVWSNACTVAIANVTSATIIVVKGCSGAQLLETANDESQNLKGGFGVVTKGAWVRSGSPIIEVALKRISVEAMRVEYRVQRGSQGDGTRVDCAAGCA